jgi:hypothetical protein
MHHLPSSLDARRAGWPDAARTRPRIRAALPAVTAVIIGRRNMDDLGWQLSAVEVDRFDEASIASTRWLRPEETISVADDGWTQPSLQTGHPAAGQRLAGPSAMRVGMCRQTSTETRR